MTAIATESLATVLAHHRLVICVGTGGVGKTTMAAAIALGVAKRGRRAMVLTIDPARALGRSLGLDLTTGQTIPVERGVLGAAMLDQKRGWDAFVARHAPTDAAARMLLGNPFYQRLSTSFAGSTEYMAIEEMCRLAESGDHDLVVLDTPPSAHAIDFLRAPERIDRLLDEPHVLVGAMARFVVRQLERVAGSDTLRDITTFYRAMSALVGGVRERTRYARRFLRSGDVAFVLVTGPRASILDDTRALADALRAQAAPLSAIVVNRTHRRLPSKPVEIEHPWLRARWDEALAETTAEAAILDPFLASLPAGIARVLVPEADHDLHSLTDLDEVATHLGI